MKYLLINKCSASDLWYSALVGTLVPYCGFDNTGYFSRSQEGKSEHIVYDDAELVIMTGGKCAALYSRQ